MLTLYKYCNMLYFIIMINKLIFIDKTLNILSNSKAGIGSKTIFAIKVKLFNRFW